MTDKATMMALAEAGSFPSAAEFSCAAYADGSGHQIKVGYDTREDRWANHILIDGYTITFEVEHAEEVIAAIRFCAAALRARAEAAR